MLVVMKRHATADEIQAVCERIEALGYRPHPMPGAQRTAIGITGNQGAVDQDTLELMSGVAEVIKVSKPYKLVSRDVKEEDTVIRFPGTNATIGGRDIAVMAGPARSKAVSRRSRLLKKWRRLAHSFCAEAPTSRAPRHTPSKGWVRRGCASWLRLASALDCAS